MELETYKTYSMVEIVCFVTLLFQFISKLYLFNQVELIKLNQLLPRKGMQLKGFILPKLCLNIIPEIFLPIEFSQNACN